MTQEQVIDWMGDYLQGTKPEQTAYGMIMADIKEYNFDSWVQMPSIPIVESYLHATEDVASTLVNDYRAMLEQEQEIEELGLDQSMRLDPVECMDAFKDGVVDVFQSLLIYLTTQEMAQAYYEDDTC